MRKKLPSLTVRADPTVMRGTFEIGRVAMPGLSPSGESPPAPRGVSTSICQDGASEVVRKQGFR